MHAAPAGRRALVTGSFQGIRLAIAEALAAEQCHLVLHGIASPEQQQAACGRVLAAGALSVSCMDHDLAAADRIDDLMATVLAAGPLDILVNNAGIQQTAPLAEMPTEVWDRVIAINLSAAFMTMKAALPGMAARGYGRVVNVASVHGLVASTHKAPYVAAKFGLVGLSKVAALEYASVGSREQGGVTVNCICPGWTETAILEPQIAARAASFGGDREAGIRDLVSEKQPSRRMSAPAEIGQLTAWLCHPIAHNITGTSIPVEGGWTSQ
ncbi:MAG: 3-hydroxybutyrate dehydrogenase [Rhodocyclales bacterium RIFCSPLOWO2_02_FULL_63_24]|nr:MAG: 3-hydroxybutyrate dehydrogenase [Rhodocyclales bacterium RIFCSPLOWO2_02_FULL_63_24]